MANLSTDSVNKIRMAKFLHLLSWDDEIVSSEPVVYGERLGNYHVVKHHVNKDVFAEVHTFDNGVPGPEVTIVSLKMGTLITIRALHIEHTVNTVKEVLSWAEEMCPSS